MPHYNEQYSEYVIDIEKELLNYCEKFFVADSEVAKAAKYSLLNGGKRVRGVLALAACEMLCGAGQKALPLACAVEMVHCYSLIHDDLPCMDNDDFRRGKPSCHKAFGETNALLAGDALLTAAFEAAAETEYAAKAVKLLAQMAGAAGMIYGQELDLYFENHTIDEQKLYKIHKNKTGRLINAAAQLGFIAANANENELFKISEYAYSIGLAFQIIDDILDVTATQEELGKPIGSDNENNKNTFVTIHGIDGSKEIAQGLTEKACKAIESFENNSFLTQLAKGLLARKN